MQVKPIQKYDKPGYPDKNQVMRNPNILKTLPKRWLGNAKVGMALSSLLVMTLSSCGGRDAGSGIEAGSADGMVSPIFDHGAGTGSFGCISVAPPVFLSEAEAFQVISDEMKKSGIELEEGKLSLKDVEIPITHIFPDGEDHADESKKGTLRIDGYDENKDVAYEFISLEDIKAWQDKKGKVWASVECYDALGTAARLKENLTGQTGKDTIALFYDPMGFDEDINSRYNEEMGRLYDDNTLSEDERTEKLLEMDSAYSEEIVANQEANLREQVKDFLRWAKAQGII